MSLQDSVARNQPIDYLLLDPNHEMLSILGHHRNIIPNHDYAHLEDARFTVYEDEERRYEHMLAYTTLAKTIK